MPKLLRAQRMSVPYLEKAARKHDLSNAEFRIVGLLVGETQGVSQTDLAHKLDISNPSLSVAIRRMEAKGFIQRINDPSDQRIKRIKLCPKVKLKDIGEIIFDLDRKATEGIKKDDLKITQRVLMQIAENLENESETP